MKLKLSPDILAIGVSWHYDAQNTALCGIIEKAARCWLHPTANTVNLFMAGCGKVIIPHFAPPASMHNGGFSMPTPQARFYVYVLTRPNNKPFYVGKGKGMRIYDHEAEARRGCSCHKCNVIRKIWRQGGEVQRYTVFTTDDEQEALAYEVELIALHVRANLCNHTNGGEGASGMRHTEEARRKMSKAAKNRPPVSDETRRKMSEALRNPSEETRHKLSEAGKGRRISEETRRKLVEAGKNRPPVSDETRRRLSEAHKGKVPSEESRRKNAESQRQRPPDSEETRRKKSNSFKGRRHTEETRRKISEAQKGRVTSAETRRKQSEAARNMSEETRRKMSESAKKQWRKRREEGAL
jgi:muconolactone delta-isomerase